MVFLFHKNDGVIAHTVNGTVDIASRQTKRHVYYSFHSNSCYVLNSSFGLLTVRPLEARSHSLR